MKKILFIFFFLLSSTLVYSQSCTLAVSLTSSNPAICSGNVVVLTATPSAGTPSYTYAWNTGETTQSITINRAATYTVSVSDKTAGCQPVIKSIVITSAPIPDPPIVSDVIICPNSFTTLNASGPGGGSYQWYSAAVGGNFLASGSSYPIGPVSAPTIFYVETTVAGCTSARAAVHVNLINKPTVVGATVCEGNSASLSASGSDSYEWYASASGGSVLSNNASYLTGPLSTTTTYYVVGTTSGCVSERTPVTATVTPAPQAPVVTGSSSVCFGATAGLHATAAENGVFNWYSDPAGPAGGASIISSPDYTTGPLTSTTTYYVQLTTPGGCTSPLTAVTITVNPVPSPPVAPNVAVCSGSVANLMVTAVPGENYTWYASATSQTPIGNGNTFNTFPLTNPASYYVVASNSSGCISPRKRVDVTINPLPSPPIISGVIAVCAGSSTNLHATASGSGIFEWFDTPNGTTPFFSGTDLATPVLTATTTYYVQFTVTATGCVSTRKAVTVKVTQIPAAPTVSGTMSVCAGSSATLTASGSGSSFKWYDAPVGGNLKHTGATYTTSALIANTTYYVETITNTCESAFTPVTVTVNPIPAAPSISGNTNVCPGSSANLTASNAAGDGIKWYDAATGGNLLATGNNFGTPSLFANATYYAQAVNGPCISARTAVTVSIIVTASAQFYYTSGTFCTSGSNPSPTINNASRGVFTSSPAGLHFIDNTTGEIDLGTSLTGSYNIIFTANDVCHTVSGVAVAIVTTPDAHFSYSNAAYCQEGNNPTPNFPPGASPGSFTSSPGLVFSNPNSGQINLSASTPGMYTVFNTISSSGCAPTSYSQTITIDPKIVVDAGPDQTRAIGSNAQMAGSFSSAGSVTWSGGAGSFSDPTLPNAVYTPGAGENGPITLTLTTSAAGTCSPKVDNVIINYNPIPPSPIVTPTAICSGDVATLIATAPGGIYSWYDGSNNFLVSGVDTYLTPALTTNTTYYVETTINGVTSARTQVTVVVNAIPAPPMVSGSTTVCSGSSTTLTASGSAGSYEWYDAATGGNQVTLQGSIFATPSLTANTTYYVQTTVNGCPSSRTQVDITITPLPVITSLATDDVCSGTPLNYTITSNTAGTTYTWTRASIVGISNAAATGITNPITETLINTTGNDINVTYTIVPFANGCSGQPFDYVVTVHPTPAVTGSSSIAVCSGSSVNYTVAFNTASTNFTWSRAAVAGISNSQVSGQTSAIIQEVLYNTTNIPIDVTYLITGRAGNCTGMVFSLTVTVYPQANVSSTGFINVCSGTALNYVMTSNVSPVNYIWSRDFVFGVSNPAVSNQTSATITETLINTVTYPVGITYQITPVTNGCLGTPFGLFVVVNPQPATPVANSNSPVCINSTINLLTPGVSGAIYNWSGPNGFTSSAQNPSITNVTLANAGTYNLTITVNGCVSPAGSVQVVVNQPSVVDAGPHQDVCISATSVTLAGSVMPVNGGPGTTTGVWTSNGTGSFSPANNALTGQYIPSAQDRANGTVTLTLTSTSPDDCVPDQRSMTITFMPEPTVNAGPSQDVCNQTTAVTLSGQTSTGAGSWSTSGTGSFNNNSLTPVYTPSLADIAAGSVILKLTVTGVSAVCTFPSDTMTVRFIPPPTVYAGVTRFVLQGRTIVLNPTVSDNNVTYLWSPKTAINDVTIKNPTITGDVDRTYRLTVTDVRGCESFSDVLVKVSPPIVVTNTFTPNADGINDVWDIQGIIAYEGATVDIFDRYGHKLFHSVNYAKPWDGTYNGKSLPIGTYYYIIDAKAFDQKFSGYVTILK